MHEDRELYLARCHDKIRELWKSDATLSHICRELDLTRMETLDLVQKVFRHDKLRKRRGL